jgi:predicted metal-dependent phosphoesterase TrpH
MSLRICFVTPFPWPQPHDVNDHVRGVSDALRRRGHTVTVIAPSTRATDLQAGRRALQRHELGELVAIGAAVPTSLTDRVALPVGVRANLAMALAIGRFDIVHGVEPGLPSLSYAALLEAETSTAATFFSPERLMLARKNRRAKLLARVDALLATSTAAADAAARRFPGQFTVIAPGVDPVRFAPGRKRKLIVVETGTAQNAIGRAVLRALRTLPVWDVALARTSPLALRPTIPPSVRERAYVRSVVKPDARRSLLAEAALFIPLPGGSERLRAEAEACGCAIVDPAGLLEQPELAAAAVARLTEDDELCRRLGAEARARAEAATFDHVAGELERTYLSIAGRRRGPRPAPARDPLANRDRIVVDLHMHTRYSHDCSIEPQALIDYAAEAGLGAIGVTDHNVFRGAQETAALAKGSDLIVIPGEEVKTHEQGEVIGLFLRSEIPRGMSFADTVAAIREQEGVVYVPHPFDRMHAIPAPATLHHHLHEIDVLEVYNARLLFETYNDEALRFQRKYGLLAGAGSDAHVLQGVGTGALSMRRFDGPEEFLLSLRTAEVLRRPKSLAYLQSLKWVAQVKEKVR